MKLFHCLVQKQGLLTKSVNAMQIMSTLPRAVSFVSTWALKNRHSLLVDSEAEFGDII